MSTSLKVVSMAAVRCASTSRRAMVARRLVIRTRSSLRSPAGQPARGAAARAPAWRAARRRSRAPRRRTRRTSCLVTRGPAAGTAARLTACSLATFLAAGVASRRRRCCAGAARGGRRRRAAVAAASRRGAAAFAGSSTASTSPTFTSAPFAVRDAGEHAGAIGAHLEIDLLGLELDERLAERRPGRLPSSASARRAPRPPTRPVPEQRY